MLGSSSRQRSRCLRPRRPREPPAFFHSAGRAAGSASVTQSRVQLHFGRVRFGDRGFGEARDFVGQREFLVVIGVGRARVAPGVNRVVLSLPTTCNKYSTRARRLRSDNPGDYGARGFEFVRQRDGLFRFAQIHRVRWLPGFRGNIEQLMAAPQWQRTSQCGKAAGK